MERRTLFRGPLSLPGVQLTEMESATMKHQGLLGRAFRQSDLLIALGIVGIVVMMIVPIPTMLLDVFITLNIAMALCIVLVTIYAKDALEFSVFPSLLLVATLFRLAINISVTRQVLLHADAGNVVKSF